MKMFIFLTLFLGVSCLSEQARARVTLTETERIKFSLFLAESKVQDAEELQQRIQEKNRPLRAVALEELKKQQEICRACDKECDKLTASVPDPDSVDCEDNIDDCNECDEDETAKILDTINHLDAQLKEAQDNLDRARQRLSLLEGQD